MRGKTSEKCGLRTRAHLKRSSGDRETGEAPPQSSLFNPRWAAVLLFTALLTACGSTPKRSGPAERAPPGSGGGYYLDDGPGANAPANIEAIPDAVPKIETLGRGTMRPYTVMGRNYTPMTRLEPYKARGIASWYGRRYHGKQTSSGEIYDMYAMTAAHTVLPIPSYVRVTNVSNGKSVVLRVNDRGPFIDNRLIDLSYTAAYKLGILGAGSGMVDVESIIPGQSPVAPQPAAAPAPVAPAPPVPVAIETAPITAIPLPPPAPVAAPQPATPAATSTGAAATGGSYLQFGAFGVQANAESYLARLQTQADWLAGTLRIQQSEGIYRVQAGPYASEAAAREAAERAGQMLGTRPVVINR
ncbi:MAG: septal ring lytic transglycosylase RlpA family protein [Burkholderiales bacterium]|nr:septal ring lytic transglycosylase RlpA family protein [Burkholderiales bacterium]